MPLPFIERASSRRFAWIVLVAAWVLVVPAGFVAASGPNGTLRGFVADRGTAAAIVGASVLVTTDDLPWSFEATTDANGYYAISVPNHLYSVVVSAPAYYVGTTSVGVGSGSATWLNVSLDPAGSRSARVQGYVKDSVSGAPVTVGRIVAEAPYWYSGTTYRNASALNASGYYEVRLVPGTYIASTDGVAGYAPYSSSYLYPGSGDVEWLNITLDPNGLVAWINGTVVDSSDYTPIIGASVTAVVDGLALPPTVSNATGEYSLHVPTGTVDIAGDALGYAPDSGSVYVYSPGTYSHTIYLTRMTSGLRGYVRDGLTGGPVRGAGVVASPFWSSGYYDRATTDFSGAYALNLPAEDCDVRVTADGYTSWATYAFLSSGEVVWANLTLWPLVAPVRGYVTDGLDGSPLSGRSVYAYDLRSGYSTAATSDALGRFNFTLPPGPAITLRIYGYAPYAGAVAYVTTRPYVTNWVNLTLPRVDVSVFATVTDGTTGSAIPDASVSIAWGLGYNWGTTDAGGQATVGAVSGLPLTVSAAAVGYFSSYMTLPALYGPYSLTMRLNPVLAENVTVRGYVVDAATNASISTAWVEASGYDGSAPYDYTDGSGYYTLSVVAAPQTIRVTEYGYAAGVAAIDPAPGSTIWINFSLAQDGLAPQILSFTANPSAGLEPSNPATLTALVNESSLSRETFTILMQRSVAAGVGTFLSLGTLDPSLVSVTPTTPGNASVSTTWDTRSAAARLSDGTTSDWWATLYVYYPYEVAVSGLFDNATLGSPIGATAYFDTRTGNLLFLYGSFGFLDPQDQPTATFTPYGAGLRIDLTTGAVLGSLLVTGLPFQVGLLHMEYTNPVPGGPYAALLETWDAAGNYVRAATLLQVATDSIAPTARAGPDQTVDQGTTVVFDGTASTDNVGIASYAWTFVDGTLQTLYGSIPSHRFDTPGAYAVTLTVSDSNGNTATDTLLITVRDTEAPVVSITTPSSGANVSGTVLVAVTASDNVAVVRVAFLVDGSWIGNATAAPFQIDLNTRALVNGNHTIEAVAYDAAGNSASSSRSISVYNVPGSGEGPGILGLDPLFLVFLALVVPAAILAILLLASRRRRPRAPMAVPSPTQAPAATPIETPSAEEFDPDSL